MMKNNKLAEMRELVDNPTPRVPVVLCLDISGSMSGRPVDDLQEGLRQYRDEMLAEDLTRYSVETALIPFNDDVRCVSDFCSVDAMKLPALKAKGCTYMGEALTEALDRLDARKAQYRSAGVDYYQPILVLMTDGQPNGDPSVLADVTQRIRELQKKRKLTLVAVGVGRDADLQELDRLCETTNPVHLNMLQFREFFSWLSQSVSMVSSSMPGGESPLDFSVLENMEAESWDDMPL